MALAVCRLYPVDIYHAVTLWVFFAAKPICIQVLSISGKGQSFGGTRIQKLTTV